MFQILQPANFCPKYLWEKIDAIQIKFVELYEAYRWQIDRHTIRIKQKCVIEVSY